MKLHDDEALANHTTRASRASHASPAAPPATWWFTLAHAATPALELALPGAQLDELIACLEARGQPVAPVLRSHERLRQRSARAGDAERRYVWAFQRLRDALLAARANHRSDYHAYPRPTTLREASLDRLYRRFPLPDYPQTTVLLLTGAQVCADPLLGPDPAPRSRAATLPATLAPEVWDRYTLCGFERGAALISVLPSDRWLRVSLATLEEAFAVAARQLQAPRQRQGWLQSQHGETGALSAAPTSSTVEGAALACLLGDLPDSAFALVSAPAHAAARKAARKMTREGENDRARWHERAHSGQPV